MREPNKPSEKTGQDESLISSVVDARRRHKGFLPIKTNWFDRFFISAISLVAIHLLWLRFLEVHFSLWFAMLISLALGYVIVRYG
jgi:predicted small integral membrane protein